MENDAKECLTCDLIQSESCPITWVTRKSISILNEVNRELCSKRDLGYIPIDYPPVPLISSFPGGLVCSWYKKRN